MMKTHCSHIMKQENLWTRCYAWNHNRKPLNWRRQQPQIQPTHPADSEHYLAKHSLEQELVHWTLRSNRTILYQKRENEHHIINLLMSNIFMHSMQSIMKQVSCLLSQVHTHPRIAKIQLSHSSNDEIDESICKTERAYKLLPRSNISSPAYGMRGFGIMIVVSPL